MSRPRSTDRNDRWYFPQHHELYNKGYCYRREDRGDRVYTCVKGPDGKALRASTDIPWNVKHKKAALEVLEQRIYDSMNGLEESWPVSTLFGLVNEYIAVHFPKYSQANKQKFKQAIFHFIREDFSLTDLDKIRLHLMINLEQSVKTPTKKQKESEEPAEPEPLHSNTKVTLFRKVNMIFDYGVEVGYLDRNPITKNMKPKGTDSEDVLTYTDEEFRKITDYFEALGESKRQFVLLLKFLSVTGARIEETLKIYWSDIDYDIMTIHGKGSKDRKFWIEFFPELTPILRELEAYREANKGKLFLWHDDARIGGWLRDASKKLGIYEPGKLFHSIRKTTENKLIDDERLDQRIVGGLLGHTAEVQAKHYTKKMEGEYQKEVLKKRLKKESE